VQPTELHSIVDKVAEKVHETWAAKRRAEGWRYGPERCDSRKEHPCLVSYSDLSESEREYDRATALTVIEALLCEGYELLPPRPSSDG
jgi:hypothetical protein